MIKLLPYILFAKKLLIFQHWKWPAQETGIVPIVSAHFRPLFLKLFLNLPHRPRNRKRQVCVQLYLRTLTTWHCPHSLAFTGSNRSISPARRAHSSKTTARCCSRRLERTGGGTLYSFIDPAPPAVRALPTKTRSSAIAE